MPILNPQQAFNITIATHKETNRLFFFLKALLPLASEKVFENRKMNKIHQRFSDFVFLNTTEVFDLFNFSEEDIFNFLDSNEENMYKKIFNTIKQKNINPEKKGYPMTSLGFTGDLYQSIKNPDLILPDIQSLFYIAYFNDSIGIYISNDSAYAVISFKKLKNIFLINLVSYILAGAGLKIVLCVFDKEKFFRSDDLNNSLYSEIHIFGDIYCNDIALLPFFSLQKLENGYVYLYAYSHVPSNEINIKKYNSDKTKYFFLSKEIESIFEAKKPCTDFQIIDEWDINSLKKKEIMINLCNVPLYQSSEENDWTPIKLSSITAAVMSSDDFENTNLSRVKIKIDKTYYYIDFEELHLMNPELFISEPMYLAEQSFDIGVVEQIQKSYKRKTTFIEKKKVKNSNIKSNIEYKMHSAFHFLNKFGRIDPYTSQIYAVYQAVSYLGLQKNKGIVLQVHTGEGKSYIVQVLAEQLARQGNTVHIATSNIILAARDFEKSYKYYRYCEQKAAKHTFLKEQRPSILIHEKEKNYLNIFIEKLKGRDPVEYESFYSPESFENQTNMNISVCQQNTKVTSNIVYSTFLNFEAFYLNENEKNPNHLQSYINNCYLIIDEADTILIDELPNGTIISKPMKSNGIEVLEYVYNQYINKNDKAESIFSLVKNEFPECTDLTIEHVIRMISDIEKVLSPDFCINVRYIISEDPKDNKIKVVPFDSEHKGIAEPNKEFSGFIHQFIGIKEKRNNPEKYKDLEIQPISMNYLFISHPIYVNKYKGVCGVTGTVGTDDDKKTLENYYNLITHEVPRHQMNLRKDLPTILCNDIEERDICICIEIQKFHQLDYPVLVVFNDISKIDEIKELLIKGCKVHPDFILTFSGSDNDKNESHKQQMENESGKPGMITLGTNFCGRGISIDFKEKPLCVIVTYYNEDKRSINQVLGRAGRNGYPGLTRIICTKEMFLKGDEKPDKKAMISILKDYEVKNKAQLDFANDIRSRFSWIFDETVFNKEMTKENITGLKKYNINVNRLTAYHWKFPVCMTYKTFMKIQAQRIFSIKNCPECKYTWNLFRNYLRELILESWSLFLEQLDADFEKMTKQSFKIYDKDYSKVPGNELYQTFFKDEYDKYTEELFKYFPENDDATIADVFVHIYKLVGKEWEHKILGSLPEQISKKHYSNSKKNSYTCFKIGFFPMSICEKSGSRITPLNEYEQEKSDKGQSYIIDPELRYLKKDTRDIFSITCAIDKIYEKFQDIFDQKLQGLFGIRFFLRRTLGGCEFGICVDPKYENLVDKDEFLNCLVDKDPIIMLTICTKSTFFWIAGILMVLLVFSSSIITIIFSHYITPARLGSGILSFLKKGLVSMANGIGGGEKSDDAEISIAANLCNCVFTLIINFLLNKIIANIKDSDEGFGIIADTLFSLFFQAETAKIDEKLNEAVFSKLKINEKIQNYVGDDQPFGKMIKIGILLVILMAQFIMNFKKKLALKFSSYGNKAAENYQKEDNVDTNKKKDLSKYDSYCGIKDEIKNDIKKEYIDTDDPFD
ncbi:hypothetical protein M9Y10_005243 [Tritrichomonas musculus]|uniref:SecA family profile domain-containing protein n=1 Tax=Tritrichomonas musculus TaxID=1915356 RepID=A0ABR2JMX5_9EUKA